MYVYVHVDSFMERYSKAKTLHQAKKDIFTYMNNQVYRALLRKNEKGKKEKERKLQQPQHVHEERLGNIF